jgi:Ser/Thr protein kinase RdoA (MazF antagonist)
VTSAPQQVHLVPVEVASAWGWHADAVESITGGLINATYVVRVGGQAVAVLQRLHPIFGAEVNLDLEAVTNHLAARGVETPRLLRTLDGRAWCEHEQRVWRATTWVEGESVAAVPDPEWARVGGELVGQFHRAVADLSYEYRFVRSGVHDTQLHLARLRACIDSGAVSGSGAGDPNVLVLGHEILAAATQLPELPTQPKRHIHGDLKISNLLFRRYPIRAVALVDLDTLGHGSLAFELGDAMRSWCNPHGEDAGQVRFDISIFATAIAGFREVADSILSDAERTSVGVGLETVCVELAARFAVDVYEDRYFGWDPTRFESRRAHNLVRARGQLALATAVRAARREILEIVSAGS